MRERETFVKILFEFVTFNSKTEERINEFAPLFLRFIESV